ncbi:MAG: mannosyltransferase family protein [Planctomycetaceae bacterium]
MTCLEGVAVGYSTTLIVVAAVEFSLQFMVLCQVHPGSATRTDLLSCFAAWDGEHYVRIASEGYSWHPDRMSNVAFFPAYPVLGAMVCRLTGFRTEAGLLVVNYAALAGCFVLFGNYVRSRSAQDPTSTASYALLSLGLWPTTFWMRMCYTESLFLFVTLAAMLSMQHHRHPLIVALIIGFATATRSTGVALIPVFCLWLWRGNLNSLRSQPEPDSNRRTLIRAGLLATAYLPVMVWGLIGYMTWLNHLFGDPFVFMQTQIHWTERPVDGPLDNLFRLVTLEPFRAVYDAADPGYWGRVPPNQVALLNLKFTNPIFVAITVLLLIVGIRRGWINAGEWILAAGLLGIALWFQGVRTTMMSQARYASVVYPVYIILGQILSRIPSPIAAMLCACSAVVLAAYSAMFCSWYFFY